MRRTDIIDEPLTRRESLSIGVRGIAANAAVQGSKSSLFLSASADPKIIVEEVVREGDDGVACWVRTGPTEVTRWGSGHPTAGLLSGKLRGAEFLTARWSRGVNVKTRRGWSNHSVKQKCRSLIRSATRMHEIRARPFFSSFYVFLS